MIFIKKDFLLEELLVSDNRFGHVEIPGTIKPSIEFYSEKICTNNISEIKLIDPKRIRKVSH